MEFLVDKVYEDSFYVNALLGLPKVLDKYKRIGVKHRHLTRYPPALHGDISTWEQKHSVLLPEDLRAFYQSTDGFLFQWTYNFGREKNDVICKIHINNLQELIQVYGYETSGEACVNMDKERYELKLTLNSKVFSLTNAEAWGKVVLVYLNTRYAPTVWLLSSRNIFYYLADNFTTYFRMSIAHLGIPYWQFNFTPIPMPPWAQTMFRLLAPHLLPGSKSVEMTRKAREAKYDDDFTTVPLNKLDPNVFKCTPKNQTNLERGVTVKLPNKSKKKADKVSVITNKVVETKKKPSNNLKK